MWDEDGSVQFLEQTGFGGMPPARRHTHHHHPHPLLAHPPTHHTSIVNPNYPYFPQYWDWPSNNRATGPTREPNFSKITNTAYKFSVHLDVRQFKPEELKVSQEKDTVSVEGSHEEQTDDHGSVSRHFVRKYKLPKDVDFEKLTSHLTRDGVLTIVAPKLTVGGESSDVIPIPITVVHTEQKPDHNK